MKCVDLLLLACLFTGVCSAKYSRTVSYEGELVIRCSMGDGIGALLSHDLVDVWSINSDHADIRLSYTLYEQLRADIPSCFILHPSVESLVQKFENSMNTNLTAGWFEKYHTYDEIVDWYAQLATNFSDIVKYNQSIGKSYEGRDQPAVHITAAADNADKKLIYFQCQIHSQEWITGATCMYIANYLVENNGKVDRVTNLLKQVEFVFVPLVNPDGYVYTWTTDRFWRKNRRPGTRTNRTCDPNGVDINRNYNNHWGGVGGSRNECSLTYHGASAESEPETRNTANYFRSLGNIVGAIDWHSFMQLILRPYGWTNKDSPNEVQLKALGDLMRVGIHAVHGMNYTSEKSNSLYPTTGSASDWFYSDDANKGNMYRAAGFTIELRDMGQYAFLLPPDQIIPNGEEIVPAVLTFAEKLSAKPLKKKTYYLKTLSTYN